MDILRLENRMELDALPRLKPWDSGVTNVLRHLAMVL